MLHVQLITIDSHENSAQHSKVTRTSSKTVQYHVSRPDQSLRLGAIEVYETKIPVVD